jgi:hypothetical protein
VIRPGIGCLGIQELDARSKGPKKNYGNYQDCRPSNIPLAGGDLLIFPNAVCEAVNMEPLKGRYKNLHRKCI